MKTRKILSFILIIGSLLVLPVRVVRAERIPLYRYVVPGGSTTSASCSGAEPCDLRYAIDVVANQGDILIVHSGTYTSALPSEDLIFIDKSLTLWGSCEFDSTTPFICYPELHNSNLDGENTKRVIRIEGDLGTEEINIEGFTIMRGSGAGMTPCYGALNGCGGGIHATNIEKLTLSKNYIWDNQAGVSGGVGGGLYTDYVNFVESLDNIFIFNQATDTGLGGGGGAFIYHSGGPHAVVFENNLFNNNELNTDNTVGSAGGGLVIYQSNNAQIIDNSFEYQNSIHQNSNVRGTSIYISGTSGFSVEGNSFTNDWGPSVLFIIDDSTDQGSITRNAWWNNQTAHNIRLEGSFGVDITNNFLGRQPLSSLSRGGSSTLLYIDGYSSFGNSLDIDIFFNTFAAANYGVDIIDNADVTIYGNIFTALTDSILSSGTTSIFSVDRNLFYNNISYTNGGTNPIFSDPMLADVANGDFHLLPGSAAIDKATAVDFDIDIDGDHRPMGPGATPYDIGADEFVLSYFLPLVEK